MLKTSERVRKEALERAEKAQLEAEELVAKAQTEAEELAAKAQAVRAQIEAEEVAAQARQRTMDAQRSRSECSRSTPIMAEFDGNPINYQSFVRQFTAYIARKTQTDDMRLLFSLQHCKPDVRENIERFTFKIRQRVTD